MNLNEYEYAMMKEVMVSNIQDENLDETTAEGDDSNNSDDAATSTIPMVSNLSLKEGEKIHINFKGKRVVVQQHKR